MKKTADIPLIEVSGLKNFLGGRWVHNGINFSVKKGEIIAIIGSSGCGKTTLLHSLLRLRKPTAGLIKIFGKDLFHCTNEQALQIRKRWGVLFQNNALFSSMTLLENVLFPLHEYTRFSPAIKRDVAMIKITLTGLDPEAADKFPAELSGGMQKRGALARAIALDPELLFLDEPTAGLDPNSAGDLDQLILKLRNHFGFTIVIVTHDLDTLWTAPDRVLFLGEGQVLAAGSMAELVKQKHPLIKDYFSGERARFAQRTAQEDHEL